MQIEQDTWQALQRANPVPDRELVLERPEEMAMRYDVLISKRDSATESPDGFRPRFEPPRRRTLLTAVASFAVALVVVGAATFLVAEPQGGTSTEPAQKPTTVATETPITVTIVDEPSGDVAAPPPAGLPGAGQVNFTGQHRWVEPALFITPDGKPAVFVGLGPSWAAGPLTGAAIATCRDASCDTTEVYSLPGLSGSSHNLIDGTPSNIWWAAIRDDGSPVFAVVSQEQTGPMSFDSTISTLTCDSPACDLVTEALITRVRSDSAGGLTPGIPVPQYIALALGPGNEPIIAFSGARTPIVETNARLESGSSIALAICPDAECSQGASVKLVESIEPNRGLLTPYRRLTLAIGRTGNAILTYGRRLDPSETVGETRIASCLEGDCNELELTTVETWLNTDTGGPVVALGADGLPIVAHWRWWDEIPQTAVMVCRDEPCTDAAVVALPNFGDRVNLSVGDGGVPVLTFLSDQRATVLTCADVDCSDYTLGTPLGESPHQGIPTIVPATEGFPYLAYYDTLATRQLHIERCADTWCTAVESSPSVGAQLVPVPDFEGWFDGDTQAWAQSAGLVLIVVGEVPPDPSQAVPIIRQEPAPGEHVPVGTEVTIWLGTT
jgi:hypothetical protein